MLSVTSYSDSPATDAAAAPTPRFRVGGWFSPALFRKNLNRFWPLWVAYGVTWLLAWPVVAFTTAFGRGSWYAQSGELAGRLADQVMVSSMEFGLFMAVTFGILFAMALFSYATSPRSLSMFHSFPIRREALFLTNYLTGILVMVAVLGASLLLTALVELAAGAFNGTALGLAFLSTAGKMFFFYSFAVFCSAFTGHILAIPAFFGIFNILAFGLTQLIQAFATSFLFGFTYSTPGWITWLTPVYAFIEKMDVSGGYFNEADVWVKAEMSGLYVLAVYAVAALVLTAVALLVYRRRPSETAGDVVSVWWAKPLFRYGVALCAAFSLGQGLYYLVWESFVRSSSRNNFTMMVLCMILLGLVGFFAAEMLLHKSFRVLRRGLRGAVGVAVGLLAIALCVRLDVLGVESRVPDAADVVTLSVSVNASNSTYPQVTDPEDIQLLSDIHRAIVAEKDTFTHRREENWRDMPLSDEQNDQYVYVQFNYEMKNGTFLHRSYNLMFPVTELTQEGTAVTLLADALATPTVQHASLDIQRLDRFVGGELRFAVLSQDKTSVSDDQFFSVTADQAKVLYDAVQRDIDAGNYGKNMLDSELWYQESYNARLELYYTVQRGAEEDYNYYNDSTFGTSEGYNGKQIPLNVHCTETLSALKDLGILPEGQVLLTEAQTNKIYDGEQIMGYETSTAVDYAYAADQEVADFTPAEAAIPEAPAGPVGVIA